MIQRTLVNSKHNRMQTWLRQKQLAEAKLMGKRTEREKNQAYLAESARGIAAHLKLYEQLMILGRRVNEQTPVVRDALARDTRVFRKAAVLRLDLETFLGVLNRFFCLCNDMMDGDEIAKDPFVEQVRRIRNRMIEHGYEVDREGSRSFLCDEFGPRLISETGQTECPPFGELEEGLKLVVEKYKLSPDLFFAPMRGHASTVSR